MLYRNFRFELGRQKLFLDIMMCLTLKTRLSMWLYFAVLPKGFSKPDAEFNNLAALDEVVGVWICSLV